MEFKRDRFNGVIVDAASLPDDPQALCGAVDALVALIEHERLALAWVTLPISNAQGIPVFTAAGFSFHSCLTDQLTLVRRPFEQAFVPFIPTHTVGAGAIVINDAGELLVIRERGTTGFKLPGPCRRRRANSGFDRARGAGGDWDRIEVRIHRGVYHQTPLPIWQIEHSLYLQNDGLDAAYQRTGHRRDRRS